MPMIRVVLMVIIMIMIMVKNMDIFMVTIMVMIMRNSSSVCGIAGALAIISSLAAADDSKHYIQLNAGRAHGLPPKGDFEKGRMGKSAIYGAEFGYRINDHFRTSLSVDYRNGFSNKYSVSDTFSGEVKSTNGNLKSVTIKNNRASKIKASSLAMMANLYYDIITVSLFTPYLTVGVGAAVNKTGHRVEVIKRIGSYESINTKGTKRNFAYKLGAGTKILLSERFEVDLRYQFSDLGKFQTGRNHESYVDGELRIKARVPKARGKLRSHEVLVGVAYKF